MNKKAKFAVKTLKEYAIENQTTARGTTDISPLEEWLILKLYDIERIAEELDKPDIDKIKKLFKEEGPEYFIGVDRCKDSSSYCLLKIQGEILKVVLSKTFITETVASRERFEEEVKNLSQIFNAKIVEEN